MQVSVIYRKRFIPDECVCLKDDTILLQNDEIIITKWTTLNPKLAFSYGYSCYFLKEGVKLSKMFRSDGSLCRWYYDIVDYALQPDSSLLVTDLLADLILYPGERPQVVDLDELADAYEQNYITKAQMVSCLRRVNHLLTAYDQDGLRSYHSCLETYC